MQCFSEPIETLQIIQYTYYIIIHFQKNNYNNNYIGMLSKLCRTQQTNLYFKNVHTFYKDRYIVMFNVGHEFSLREIIKFKTKNLLVLFF